MKPTIKIYTSTDAGCEITAQEHSQFCEEVAEEVASLYPEAEVECELSGHNTRVVVLGDWGDLEDIPEDRDILAVHLDVWERGDFWA